MKKSFFALMLAAVLPAANAASVTELEARIADLTAEQTVEHAWVEVNLARLEAGQMHLIDEQNRKIEALEARISKLEKRLAKSNSYNPDRVYVCCVKPFQKLFEASGKNEWEARRAVRTACNAETSAMFCEDSAIRCEKYD